MAFTRYQYSDPCVGDKNASAILWEFIFVRTYFAYKIFGHFTGIIFFAGEMGK